MERYVGLLGSVLRSQGIQHQVCRPEPWLGKAWLPGRLRRWCAFVDKFILFPWVLRRQSLALEKEGPVVVHVPDQGNSLYLTWFRYGKTLVTCHDFIAIRASLGMGGKPKPSIVQKWILYSLRKAKSYVFVSHHTRQLAQSLLGNAASRCAVVANPLDPSWLNAQPPSSEGRKTEPFLLHVGNSAWYKNRPGLFRIYAALRQALPLAPALHLYGEPLQPQETALLHELDIVDHVTCHARPTDEAIRLAYHRAEALIFPSLEEGFGWPPLEAMACGCPVFASNRPPLTEIGGDAVEYIDPEHPGQAAALIASRLQQGQPWRNERAAAGRARAAEFNMERFTSEMIAVYQTVLALPET